MICPACHNQETKVLDSRMVEEGFAIRRRRACSKCSFRFSTYEELEVLDLMVLKKNGQRESYSKDKLLGGLQKALDRVDHDSKKLKKILQKIEIDIQVYLKNKKCDEPGCRREIKSSKIGDICMKHLKKFNKVGYLKFVAVCKAFNDPENFYEELEGLLNKRKS